MKRLRKHPSPRRTGIVRKRPFSKVQLLIFLVIFAGVGYLIFQSFAAGNTKTWDTQADFQGGILSGTIANNDGTLSLGGFTSGTFQPDGVHMFMTDAEAAQMKKNIDDPNKPEIKRAFDNTKASADGCGISNAPPNSTDGWSIYQSMLSAGACAKNNAIVYKYYIASGNPTAAAPYANKAVGTVDGWTSLNPNLVTWGGPGREVPMATLLYAYDLTREKFNSTQLNNVKNWGVQWAAYGKVGVQWTETHPFNDRAPWGDSATQPMMESLLGATVAGDQATIDYLTKNNDLIVDLATIQAVGDQRMRDAGIPEQYIPYSQHCDDSGSYGSPDLPPIDKDVNGKPFTLKTILIGSIGKEGTSYAGQNLSDCRASMWYTTFQDQYISIMATIEQHRHDTSVWPNGDPYQYTNVAGGTPKLKLMFNFTAGFLGHQNVYPWPAGYDRDQYTYVGSPNTVAFCGATIQSIGDSAFVCMHLAHYNDLYTRLEDGYNHYPSSTALRDAVNATSMQGFAPRPGYSNEYNTNLNGQSLVRRGDRNGANFPIYGAVTGDLGPVSSSEGGSTGGYVSPGTITLSLDAGVPSGFSGFAATDSKPSGTNIVYEARSSCDNSSWGTWVPVASVSSGRYLQLRATLSTTSASTPSIDKLAISYTADGSACEGPPPPSGLNLLQNGDFSNGVTGWNFFSDVAGNTFSVSNGQGVINIGDGRNTSNTQLYQTPITLIAGRSYHLSFDASSSTSAGFKVEMIKHVSPYANYGLSQTFSFTGSMNSYNVDFTASGFSGTVTDGRLKITLNGQAATLDSYTLDNFNLVDNGTAPPDNSKKGDLNNDSKIDIQDLSILLSHYGKSGTGDFNNDGVVNIIDLSTLLTNYGK